MEYREWVASLKADDKVAIDGGDEGLGGPRYRIAKVERITPTGRIVVGGRQFGKDGYTLGRFAGQRASYLTRIDDNVREYFKRRKALAILKEAARDPDLYSTESLIGAAKLLADGRVASEADSNGGDRP